MIMGDRCTRSCRYCAVTTARPLPLDPDEPARVALAALNLGLKHVVITSVTRDDLPDEGVGHFARVVRALRDMDPSLIIEILTQDFRRRQDEASAILRGLEIDIFNHNIETVRRLHKVIRPGGGYDLSLNLIRNMAGSGGKFITKSGAMLGLGETWDEVTAMMQELRDCGCEILTLGQYLRPDPKKIPVARYIRPEEFEEYREAGYRMGFSVVESGPFVRSSYHAKDSFEKIKALIGRRPVSTHA